MLRSSLLCSGVVFRTTRSITCCAPALPTCSRKRLRDLMSTFKTLLQRFCVCHASEDQWDQASLPVKLSGLGVNQTKVIAGSAYIGSCTLTRALVAALLGRDVSSFEPAGVSELLSAHEAATGAAHTLPSLAGEKSVQQKLSTERHEALFEHLKTTSS